MQMSKKKYASVHERMDALITHYKLKGYPALASFLNVPYQTLMAWKKRNSIGDYLPFLDKCIKINLDWLKTGEGNMFVAEGEPSYSVSTIHRALTPEEERLLEILKVFPDVREAMEAFIQLPPRKQKIYLGKLLEEVEKLQEDGTLTPPCVRS